MADATILWQARRPPGRGAWIMAAIAGVVVGAGGGGLLHLLMLRPDWRIAAGVGGILCIAVLASIGRGALVQVDGQGILRFGFGTPNLEVPLSDCSGWRLVRAGALTGVGMRVDPDRIRFLNRKGISRRRIEEQARTLGIGLVLEHLTADDLDQLRELQARLTGIQAPFV
jgi:hypothetical protein